MSGASPARLRRNAIYAAKHAAKGQVMTTPPPWTFTAIMAAILTGWPR